MKKCRRFTPPITWPRSRLSGTGGCWSTRATTTSASTATTRPIRECSMPGTLVVGGSLMAADMILDGDVEAAFNPGGGLHHAAAGNTSGFCVFNDAVVAIKRMVNRGMKVAYVDIDVHHGDGVQTAFYDTDAVLTISVHESGKVYISRYRVPQRNGHRTRDRLRGEPAPGALHRRRDLSGRLRADSPAPRPRLRTGCACNPAGHRHLPLGHTGTPADLVHRVSPRRWRL